MKANELRIGNLVYDPIEIGGNVTTIKRIETDEDGYSGYLDHCTPILLTEEWLVNLGFKKIVWENKNYPNRFELNLYIDGILINYDSYDDETSVLSFGEFGNDKVIVTRLKYVHQLQNLYFALTGEELTIG